MGSQTGSLDLSTVFSNSRYTEAKIETKIDAVPGAQGYDLLSNINAIANQISLAADRITFSSVTNVRNEIESLKNAVVIDPTVPSITIGDPSKMHVVVNGSANNSRLSFMDGSQEVAYINGQRLYINQSVVLDEMQLGNNKWSWKYDNRDDSMFLKWIGD